MKSNTQVGHTFDSTVEYTDLNDWNVEVKKKKRQQNKIYGFILHDTGSTGGKGCE